MNQIIERILSKKVYCFLLILSAVIIIYSIGLTSYLFADDFMFIEKAKNTDWSNWQSIVHSWVFTARDSGLWWVPKDTVAQFLRPLIAFSFAIDYSLWGMNPFGFHLLNLLVHIFTSIIVFFIIDFISQNRRVSLLGSLLFTIHPCQAEAVFWVSGRCDLICGFFYFTSFFCFIKYRQADKKIWLIGSLITFILSLSAKEMTITLPLVMIIYDMALNKEKHLKTYIPFFGLLVVYLLIRFAVFGNVCKMPDTYFYSLAQPEFIYCLIRNLFSYLTGLVLGLSPMIVIPFLGKPKIVLYLIFLIVLLLILLIFRSLKGRRDFRFSYLWILISLLPVLIILPFERYLYIPSLGFSIIAALFILKITSSPGFKKVGIGLLIILLIGYSSFNIIKGARYKLGSSTVEKVVKDVKKYYPTLPDNSHLYFINLSPLACLSTSQGFRLEYNNPTISAYVLTMSPNFGPGCDSYLKVINKHILLIGLNKGSFLDNPVAQFFLLGRSFTKGEKIEWDGFNATMTKMDNLWPTEILFEFKEEIASPDSYFFEFKDWRVYPLFKKKVMSTGSEHKAIIKGE
ncbi:MAG: glycosyltransferase family 39 protein [bacterium]